jgi:hypothetical protein
LVAFGSLKPGKGVLNVKVQGKQIEGDFFADRAAGGNGKFGFESHFFGDILTFTNAILRAGGASKLCKTNADCWKIVSQDGLTMQQLKARAADAAKVHRVNPR